MTGERNERVAAVAEDLIESAKEVLHRHDVTHSEYRAAWRWLIGLADSGEIPLFLDVFFESTVERLTNDRKPGSEGAVQGPYYKPGASRLEPPYVLPMRDDEPGEPILFTGSVTDLDGRPLPGVTVDWWQAGNDGTYSGIAEGVPEWNLRGVMETDAEGRFQVRTIRPAPYHIPDSGPTGELLGMMGRHSWRPAHFHVMLSKEGYETLVTQLYFEGDPWLEKGDCVDAVKPSLIIDIGKSEDEQLAGSYGLRTPFLTAGYTWQLRGAA